MTWWWPVRRSDTEPPSTELEEALRRALRAQADTVHPDNGALNRIRQSTGATRGWRRLLDRSITTRPRRERIDEK